MNKRQRKKRAKKLAAKTMAAMVEASTSYIRFMLSVPSPLKFVSITLSVVDTPLVPPFGTTTDDEGVVHRIGLTEPNQNGDSWLVTSCARGTPIVGRGDPSIPVTCLACVAL